MPGSVQKFANNKFGHIGCNMQKFLYNLNLWFHKKKILLLEVSPQ